MRAIQFINCCSLNAEVCCRSWFTAFNKCVVFISPVAHTSHGAERIPKKMIQSTLTETQAWDTSALDGISFFYASGVFSILLAHLEKPNLQMKQKFESVYKDVATFSLVSVITQSVFWILSHKYKYYLLNWFRASGSEVCNITPFIYAPERGCEFNAIT